MQQVHLIISAKYQWRVQIRKNKVGDFDLMKNQNSVDESFIFKL